MTVGLEFLVLEWMDPNESVVGILVLVGAVLLCLESDLVSHHSMLSMPAKSMEKRKTKNQIRNRAQPITSAARFSQKERSEIRRHNAV